MSLTVIEQLSWVVAWDDASGEHVYRNNVDVAFSAEAGFTYIGPRFEGEAATRISGRGRLLFPGFVDVHSHPTSEPLRRGITDEITSPGFHHSSLLSTCRCSRAMMRRAPPRSRSRSPSCSKVV